MMCNLGYKHDQNSFNFSFEAEVNYFEGNYKTWKPGIWTQLYWLAWRSILDMRRNISHIFMHFTLYMLVALLISLPYVDVKVDQKGIQSLQGLLYLIITETIFTFMYSVTNVFPQELPVLIREISSGLYHPAPYYAAKVFILVSLC
ncbi:Protein scarlet [Blattella germanica]|nr:Protein scarlet [Blattella germanica]